MHPPLYSDAVMCRNPTVSLRSGVTRKETVFQYLGDAGYRRVEGLDCSPPVTASPCYKATDRGVGIVETTAVCRARGTASNEPEEGVTIAQAQRQELDSGPEVC